MRPVPRPTVQRELFRRVRFVNQQAARTQRLCHLRKNPPLQIKEADDQVELGLRSPEPSEIIYYKVDLGGEGPGVLPRFFDRDFGNIGQRDPPSALRQIECVASGAAGKIKRAAAAGKCGMDELRECLDQKRIRLRRRVKACAIFLIPAVAFVGGKHVFKF